MRNLFKFFIIISSFFIFTTSYADSRVCLILDKGGKDDKSFNQSAYEGFLKAKSELPISKESKYVTVREDAQSSQFVRAFSKEQCGLIIAIGFNNADVVGKIAPQFPSQKYAVIDASTPGKNIKAVTFSEHEGGFLMGAIAAMKTKTNKVGFIGGMQIPLIQRFEMGFEAGVKHQNSKVSVVQSYVGVTSTAWNNPSKAKELALSMYEQQGVDIIFVAAGASSQGVFDAVQLEKSKGKSNKKFVIGIDSNQNYIVPGFVLTSMQKKVDVEVYNIIKSYINNQFTTGHVTYGFKDGGVDWAYDSYNQGLFNQDDIKKINLIKKDIIENKISVPDFYEFEKKH
jgi:basic membrane protein A